MKKFFLPLITAMFALSMVACTAETEDKAAPSAPGAAPDAVAAVDASDNSAQVQAIKARGVLRVGVKVDVPLYSYLNPNTNEQEGLEADLARELARRIIGDEKAVEFQAVTAPTRGPLLDNGEVDVVIATFTINEERKRSYNFTPPYFKDAIGFLVKKGLGATRISDLAGKNIGVAQSATTKVAIAKKAEELGIEVKFSEFASYPELKAALMSGRIDAFSVDKSILLGYLDDSTLIINETFAPQEYGIASKLDNKDLAAFLDEFIKTSKADGTLDRLISRWGLDK
ncbi:amino acid ABC transporter substrate-binding protein [Betaproteobacteria bacterium]|nr:amino acid ABC transporter substrate-binding protein [Betaproteobacteria bacterium]